MTEHDDTTGSRTVRNETRRYLTRADVARMLGVSPNTVSRWAREGRLPCLVTLGGHHRFDPAVIEEIRRRHSRGGDLD